MAKPKQSNAKGSKKKPLKVATGMPKTATAKMKRRVDRIAFQSSKMTIGKTSGVKGMKGRLAKEYRKKGYDKIVPLYKTTSAKHANKMEKIGVKHGKATVPRKVGNKNAGGGGPDGKARTKIVYAAYKSR